MQNPLALDKYKQNPNKPFYEVYSSTFSDETRLHSLDADSERQRDLLRNY